jgi:xanthine phosphoribosyltransferase
LFFKNEKEVGPMNFLEKKICEEGIVLSSTVLKVDSFLNHQINPRFMKEIGSELADRFKFSNIDKILTIESSGIAPAVFAGLDLDVPVLFARKRKSLTLNEGLITASVSSYTKQEQNEISVSAKWLKPGERILIIDDFLAHGEAALGLAQLVQKAEAHVCGFGIVIEKSFQAGRQKLVDQGYRVESIARIREMSPNGITFWKEESEVNSL